MRDPIRGIPGAASLVPFGLTQDKPHHFREMAEVIWDNRDALPYAWRILNQGVCDGCSLGPKGLQDDVLEGPHLCTTRLRLLRINTMPALKAPMLADIEQLREAGYHAFLIGEELMRSTDIGAALEALRHE